MLAIAGCMVIECMVIVGGAREVALARPAGALKAPAAAAASPAGSVAVAAVLSSDVPPSPDAAIASVLPAAGGPYGLSKWKLCDQTRVTRFTQSSSQGTRFMCYYVNTRRNLCVWGLGLWSGPAVEENRHGLVTHICDNFMKQCTGITMVLVAPFGESQVYFSNALNIEKYHMVPYFLKGTEKMTCLACTCGMFCCTNYAYAIISFTEGCKTWNWAKNVHKNSA